MKELLVILAVLATITSVSIADDSVLDQSQVSHDAGLRISLNRGLCQTFTAGMSGNLTKVSILLDSAFYNQQYPATINIVGTTDGTPNDSDVLWTGSFDALAQGWYDADTSVDAPFLVSGGVYGIELVNNDPLTGPSHDAWNVQRTGNPYSSGSAWENRGYGWVTLSNGSGTQYPDADAAFKTYVLAVLPGDVNLDRVVDAADYIALKMGLGLASGATRAQGDLDHNSTVDLADLQILMNAMNSGSTTSSTPEPATLALMAIGALALIRRRGPVLKKI